MIVKEMIFSGRSDLMMMIGVDSKIIGNLNNFCVFGFSLSLYKPRLTMGSGTDQHVALALVCCRVCL